MDQSSEGRISSPIKKKHHDNAKLGECMDFFLIAD